jgi:predicted DNA-binding transcriptional regulator AlpA
VRDDTAPNLSPQGLAERYGLPLETIYGWNKTRSGPKYLKLGRHVRYRLSDVLAWEKTRIAGRGRVA